MSVSNIYSSHNYSRTLNFNNDSESTNIFFSTHPEPPHSIMLSFPAIYQGCISSSVRSLWKISTFSCKRGSLIGLPSCRILAWTTEIKLHSHFLFTYFPIFFLSFYFSFRTLPKALAEHNFPISILFPFQIPTVTQPTSHSSATFAQFCFYPFFIRVHIFATWKQPLSFSFHWTY